MPMVKHDERNENERTALSTFFPHPINSRLPAVVLFLSWRRVPVRRTTIDARDGCFLGPFYFRNDILRNKPEHWPAVSQSKSRMVKRIRMAYFRVLTTSAIFVDVLLCLDMRQVGTKLPVRLVFELSCERRRHTRLRIGRHP